MKLENYELNLPGYSVGEKVYDSIGNICSPYGSKILVIGGEKGMAAAREKLIHAVQASHMQILDFVVYGTDCTYENVERLKKMEVFEEADMVFAVGGGKALDTCKCLCIENDKPVFTFPTIASNCASCTSVSIMYHSDGTFLKDRQTMRLLTLRSLPVHLTVTCGQELATPMQNTMRQRSHREENSCSITRHWGSAFQKCVWIPCLPMQYRRSKTIRKERFPMHWSRQC